MKKVEKVQVVVEKTDVTSEVAQDALERCDYDVLDAIVLLEREGKVAALAAAYEVADIDAGEADGTNAVNADSGGFWKVLGIVGQTIGRLFRRSLDVTFYVDRDGAQVLAVPVLMLVLFALVTLPITIIALVVGLFLGCRYRFEGFEGDASVNDVMGHAADGAQSIRRDVMGN